MLSSAIGTDSQFKVSKPLSSYEHKPGLFGDLHGTPLVQLHKHLHQMQPSLTAEDSRDYEGWHSPLDFHTTSPKRPPIPAASLHTFSLHAPPHTPDPWSFLLVCPRPPTASSPTFPFPKRSVDCSLIIIYLTISIHLWMNTHHSYLSRSGIPHSVWFFF